jgi:RNA polymerase sigma factor (sigma-70 family)
MKWKQLVSPVLLLTLTVPPVAGAAVGGGATGVAGLSDGATSAASAGQRGSTRSRRRAGQADLHTDTFLATLAQATEYLRSREAGAAATPEARQAWDTFYGACDPCIRSYAGAFSMRGADVDDCAQDVWADLMRSLPRFQMDRSRGRFTSWLYAIVRSKAMNVERRRCRRPAQSLSPEMAANVAAPESDPAQQFDREGQRAEVRRAMATLRMQSSEQSYRVLHLRYWEGMSAPQVADALGLTPEQVWVREHRMKRKLQQLLQPDKPARARCA